MARIRETLTAYLAPDAESVKDVTLQPGSYIFNRGTVHGVTETFVGEIILDPANAVGKQELFLSSDVPFDYLFQRVLTLSQATVLRLKLRSMDLEATRWSGAAVEFDLL